MIKDIDAPMNVNDLHGLKQSPFIEVSLRLKMFKKAQDETKVNWVHWFVKESTTEEARKLMLAVGLLTAIGIVSGMLQFVREYC